MQTDPFTAAALDRATAETRAYRELIRAALDQLHAQAREIERQRRQLAEQREEQQRFARDIFKHENRDADAR